MATDKGSAVTFSNSSQTGRHMSPPPPQLRQRPLARSATFNEAPSALLNRRRSSLFSENLSETRKSLRSSTDDLLLPRVDPYGDFVSQREPSHWHSVPLGLALLPAVGGLFFHNGSAVVTDVTLLALAAIFLNWSVRLPWDWYLSAQATTTIPPLITSSFDVIEEEEDDVDLMDDAMASSQDMSPPPKPNDSNASPSRKMGSEKNGSDVAVAKKELHVHEVLALASCFLSPALGAWLLHAIRNQLSRPSEGLVSNYNLTVFLLAAEIRPMSHLVKMVQARTLYLQRVVTADAITDEGDQENTKVLDLVKRLEEMEAHIANSADTKERNAVGNSEMIAAKASAQATSDLRRGIQPDLDALNRAVRRYEKRTTISAIQTEARLQDLESRLKDVVALAAAAQRNIENQPTNFIVILLNWICGAVVVPAQFFWWILILPSKGLNYVAAFANRLLDFRKSKSPKEQRASRTNGLSRPRERKSRPAA